MRKVTFDPACFDLANYFLSDEPALAGKVDDLAEEIQSAIENWIQYEKAQAERAKFIKDQTKVEP